jgi:hypothetical protein
MRTIYVLVALAAGSVVAVAGCGGGGAQTKPQFIGKADAICLATEAQASLLRPQIVKIERERGVIGSCSRRAARTAGLRLWCDA